MDGKQVDLYPLEVSASLRSKLGHLDGVFPVDDLLNIFRELRERRRGEEIQMRRGWGAVPKVGQANAWVVVDTRNFSVPEEAAKRCWPTPTAALIAADEWLTQREKGGA